MKFNQYLLTEGVINIPRKMWIASLRVAVKYILWYIQTNLDKKNDNGEFDEYQEEINKWISTFGIDIPNKPIPKQDHTSEFVHYNITDLPRDYQELFDIPDEPLEVRINWTENTGTGIQSSRASYIPDENVIILNVKKESYIKDIPNEKSSPIVIKSILDRFASSLEHEFAHVVQDRAFKKIDPKQTKMNKNYFTDKKEYFSSPIEFESMIKTSAHEFSELIKHIHSMDNSIKASEIFDIFTVSKTTGKYPSEMVSNFFKALKETSKKRWTLAVKKLYTSLKGDDIL
jgi:hypothetical protein